MACGAPATVRKRRLFVSHPLWVYALLPLGYLPYVIVAAILTHRVRCFTHFCPRHKNHWLIRSLIIWGALAVLLILAVVTFAVLISMEKQMGEKTAGNLAGFVCLGTLVLMFCWVISIPIMQLMAIHVTNVTERRFTLVRVSPAFIEAVRDFRERPRDENEETE
jgi:hypothetical protein